jgi:hypothetical protein
MYAPSISRYQNIDGAYFGTTFPHLFLQTYPEFAVTSLSEVYEPKIFGFRVCERSKMGPRMQWLRRRPELTACANGTAPPEKEDEQWRPGSANRMDVEVSVVDQTSRSRTSLSHP